MHLINLIPDQMKLADWHDLHQFAKYVTLYFIVIDVQLRNFTRLDYINKSFAAHVVDLIVLKLKFLHSCAPLDQVTNDQTAGRCDFIV